MMKAESACGGEKGDTMILRHAILGMAAMTLLGACVSASGETKAPAVPVASAAPVAAAPATPGAALVGIEAFRGSWVGASDGDGEAKRAAALMIDASADGALLLRWRSAEGATASSAEVDPKTIRENTVLFPPSKKPGVWTTRLKTGARANAQLEGALLLTELTVKTRGKTEVQSYRRTLTAPGQLSLHYTRTLNGKVESSIDADYIKLP